MKKINSSRGFTLIELMITLVLSLLITYAIAQVLISSNRTSVASDGISQSQETGRFATSFMANHIRQAGLDSIDNKNRTAPTFISCRDFPALVDDGACISNSSVGENQTEIIRPDMIHGDRIAISWIPPVPNDAAGVPDENLIRDCTGTGGYLQDQTIINTFWVAFDTASGMNSLFCQSFTFDGNDVTRPIPAQAIANGVETMQILYGESTVDLPDNKNRNISRYVPAAIIPTAPLAGDVSDWSKVYSVKISILTRSITDVTNSNTLRRYVLADASPYLMTDSVSRQVFTTTFVINNYDNN